MRRHKRVMATAGAAALMATAALAGCSNSQEAQADLTDAWNDQSSTQHLANCIAHTMGKEIPASKIATAADSSKRDGSRFLDLMCSDAVVAKWAPVERRDFVRELYR